MLRTRLRCRPRLFALLLTGLICVPGAGPVRAQLSPLLNPTGEPIGGWVGYQARINAAEATYRVASRAALEAALAQARSGEVIYVEDAAVIDLSGAHLRIPAGVTLASGRGEGGSPGALLFSNSLYANSNGGDAPDDYLFKTAGPGVRVTGLRLRGPYGHVGDHAYDVVGVANGIRGSHGWLEVDNSELWDWNKWAIDLEVARGDRIHHNYIHHTTRSGYGYGVWVRGSGTTTPPSEDEVPRIEANLFDFNRHHVGAGGQNTSSYVARYNYVLPHNLEQRFDRHGDGHFTEVSRNFIMGTFQEDFGGMDLPPLDRLVYRDNWSDMESLDAAFPKHDRSGWTVETGGNVFGGAGRALLPTAYLTAGATSGQAPFSVAFDASASTARPGHTIDRYLWRFGEGTERWTTEPVQTFTFDAPGFYVVEVYAGDELGVLSVPARLPVYVQPPTGRYVLSAWVKDSYDGALARFYKKQALVGGTVVWEDDVAGSEGWQHLLVDVSAQVQEAPRVEVAFRLVAETGVTDPERQIVEIFVWVDDVHLFGGGPLTHPTFEFFEGWGARYEGEGWNVRNPTDEVRSGERSARMERPYQSTSQAGTYVEIFQEVATGTPAEGRGEVPASFRLYPNYPNPFNLSTVIDFALRKAGFALLDVYDVLGRQVATLVAGFLPEGRHRVRFEAAGLPSGMYYYRLQAEGQVGRGRMTLVR